MSALPRLLNPRGGYIQNANNPPAYVSLHRSDRHVALPSAEFERGPLALRPQLALDLIGRQPVFNVENLIRLKYDTRMCWPSG